MKRSSNRILTTHVGSLIRPARLLELVRAKDAGDSAGAQAYDQCLKDSVAEVVGRQAQAGIDVVNDGEFGKSTSWALYALKRVSGFEMRPVKVPVWSKVVCTRRVLESMRSSKPRT